MQHGLDDLVHCIGVGVVDHELRGTSEFFLWAGGCSYLDRLRLIRHEEAVDRVLGDGIAVAITAQRAAVGAPSQARQYVLELARSQLCPVGAVLWNDAVASDLGQHHAECEYISGLVEATGKSLWCKIVAIALTIDALWCRPGAGETKVGNFQRTSEVDEDVGRLQIEVDVSRVVDEGKPL